MLLRSKSRKGAHFQCIRESIHSQNSREGSPIRIFRGENQVRQLGNPFDLSHSPCSGWYFRPNPCVSMSEFVYIQVLFGSKGRETDVALMSAQT